VRENFINSISNEDFVAKQPNISHKVGVVQQQNFDHNGYTINSISNEDFFVAKQPNISHKVGVVQQQNFDHNGYGIDIEKAKIAIRKKLD
jgi:hypothetical protein